MGVASVIAKKLPNTLNLYDEIKRNLEHIRDFFQSCCPLSPSAFQVGYVTLSDVSLVRSGAAFYRATREAHVAHFRRQQFCQRLLSWHASSKTAGAAGKLVVALMKENVDMVVGVRVTKGCLPLRSSGRLFNRIVGYLFAIGRKLL